MMIKLNDEDAALVLRALRAYEPQGATPPDVETDRLRCSRIVNDIRTRLPVREERADVQTYAGDVAGAVLSPERRASHWRKPVPGIDR